MFSCVCFELDIILYHHTILKLGVYFDCGSEVYEYFQVIRPQLIPQKAFCGELQNSLIIYKPIDL